MVGLINQPNFETIRTEFLILKSLFLLEDLNRAHQTRTLGEQYR